jgi:hypothetical protein
LLAVFLRLRVLPGLLTLLGLDTEAQLHEFLKASPSNVAVMPGESEPAAPLKVLKIMMVGRQAYYFVGE